MIFLASLREKSATRSNLFRRNIGLILGGPRSPPFRSTFLSARKQTGNDKTTTSVSKTKMFIGIENETFEVW